MQNKYKIHYKKVLWKRRIIMTMISLILILATPGVLLAKGGPPDKVDVIVVHKRGSDSAASVVRGHGGQVKHQLGLINAVSVSLPVKAIEALRKNKNVQAIYPDVEVQFFFSLDWFRTLITSPISDQVALTRASDLHNAGVTGDGVTVAVLDSGLYPTHSIRYDTQGNDRFLAYYDILQNTEFLK